MLAGRGPFDGDTAVAIPVEQASEEPVRPSGYNGPVKAERRGCVLRAPARTSDRPCVRAARVQRDKVMRLHPQPNTRADEGSAVSLTASGGPGRAVVPSVDGLTQSQARKKLDAAGFKGTVSRESSDRVAEGQVTRTAPPAG